MDRLPGTVLNTELTGAQRECLRLGEKLKALHVERRTVSPGHVAKVDAEIAQMRQLLAETRQQVTAQQPSRPAAPVPSPDEARRAGQRTAIHQRLGQLATLVAEQVQVRHHVRNFYSHLLDALRAEEQDLHAELARLDAGGLVEKPTTHFGRAALESLARRRLEAINLEMSEHAGDTAKLAELGKERDQMLRALGETR